MMIGVFVPSLMGVGILVSGAILLGDLVRRHLPQGGLRRRHRVAMGTFAVVSEAGSWVERSVSAGDLLDRAPRHRSTYAAWALACAIAGVIVPAGLMAAHRDELGLFHESPWMIGLSIAAAIVAGVLLVVIVAVGILAGQPVPPIAWLVAHTPIGRLQVPDPLPFDDPAKGDPCDEP